MFFVDAHAHLYDEKYNGRENEVIAHAKQYGVERIICAASDIEKSKKCIEIASKYEGVYATVGVHPEDASGFSEETVQKLRKLAKHEKVVAIGEIGLDYYWKEVSHDVQKEAFISQLKLANELNLPVVIHVREATGDMIEILKTHKNLLKNGGIIHCFNKNWEVAKLFLELGLCLSIGGALTFPNSHKLCEAVANIPLNRLMLETDCPYMAPVPLRGTINEPMNVIIVAENIAKIKGISVEEVQRATTENALRVFRIR